MALGISYVSILIIPTMIEPIDPNNHFAKIRVLQPSATMGNPKSHGSAHNLLGYSLLFRHPIWIHMIRWSLPAIFIVTCRRRDNTPERPAERAAERAAEHLARETRDAVKAPANGMSENGIWPPKLWHSHGEMMINYWILKACFETAKQTQILAFIVIYLVWLVVWNMFFSPKVGIQSD